jgi:hypothetical protein
MTEPACYDPTPDPDWPWKKVLLAMLGDVPDEVLLEAGLCRIAGERVSVADYDNVARMLSKEQMACARACRERDAAELERDVAERDARQFQSAVESLRRERQLLIEEIERLRGAVKR